MMKKVLAVLLFSAAAVNVDGRGFLFDRALQGKSKYIVFCLIRGSISRNKNFPLVSNDLNSI